MVLVNNPGSWNHIYAPLDHAPWHGCSPTDLVFPFFLFAVGNSLAFSLPRLETKGTGILLQKVATRGLLIFGIGLFLSWLPFFRWQDDQLLFRVFDQVRILGVLQRIAICYFFASLIIYLLRSRGAILTAIIILLGYWGATLLLGSPPDPYGLEGFWGTHVDRAILGEGHMYKGEGVAFDPEGLASSLPAIVQVIIGYLVGRYIQRNGSNYEMLTKIFVAGAILTFLGPLLEPVFSIE